MDRSKSLPAVNKSIVKDPNASTTGKPSWVPEKGGKYHRAITNFELKSRTNR